MKLVTPEQMRQMDHATIHDVGLPGVALMERAALGATDALMEHFGSPERVGLMCGGGNNGGDGFAMARMLAGRGVEVLVIALSDPEDLEGDARLNWEILDRLDVPVHALHDVDAETLHEELASFAPCPVWCDALLGTGLDRPVEGRYASAIAFLREREAVFAVDIPSGLHGRTGQVMGCCARAQACATFGLPKLGQALEPGRSRCGQLYVIDIGQPPSVIEQVGTTAEWLDEAWARRALPARAVTAHKGDAGKLLLLAGSGEMSGAAIICARAAVHGGAGLVTVGTQQPVLDRLLPVVPEAMAAPVLPEVFGDAIRRALQSHLDRADVVAMGPGIGQREGLADVLEHILLDPRHKLVLDADALNLVADHELHEALRRGTMRRPIVLTPHPGEMARLIDSTIEEVLKDPISQARDLAQVTQCVVALKTATTVIAAPDGRLAVNRTGNPGLASGGTGDALTGLVAARLAEHEDAFEATCLAVWIHGAAGDLCRQRRGMRATSAMGLIDALGPLFVRLEAPSP